jgi:hypothetical protein
MVAILRTFHPLSPAAWSKAEDVSKPVNPITFFFCFLVGTICAAYYVLVPIYMRIKDQIVPKGSQSKGWELSCSEEWIASI